MQTSKFLLGALLCLSALAACNSPKSIGPSTDVQGKINTGMGFSFLNSDGKQVALPANQSYDAVLRLGKTASELDITISDGTVQSILLPKLTSDQEGNFKIGAADSDQRFDSVGAVAEATATSDNTHTESCVLSYTSQYVCSYSLVKKNILASLAKFKVNAQIGDHPGSSPNDPIPGGPGPGYGPAPGSSPSDPIPGGPGPGYEPPPSDPTPPYTPPPSYTPDPSPGSSPSDPIPGGPGYNPPPIDPSPGSSPSDPIPGGPGNDPQPDPTPYTPPPAPVETCGYENVPVYGTAVVHEVVKSTDKNVTISFNDSATQQSLGSFTGSLLLSTQDVSSSSDSCR